MDTMNVNQSTKTNLNRHFQSPLIVTQIRHRKFSFKIHYMDEFFISLTMTYRLKCKVKKMNKIVKIILDLTTGRELYHHYVGIFVICSTNAKISMRTILISTATATSSKHCYLSSDYR